MRTCSNEYYAAFVDAPSREAVAVAASHSHAYAIPPTASPVQGTRRDWLAEALQHLQPEASGR